MDVASIKFGFCPLALHISGNDFSIEPLDDVDSNVKEIQNCGAAKDGWLYSNLISSSGASFSPGRVFGLPKTHMLSIQGPSDEEKLRFVIWCLSFLVGMRLTTTEAGFLDAAPVKPRLLVDFFTDEKDISRGLERALRFHDLCSQKEDPSLNTKRYEAAIHALFLAQNPSNLPFEEFSYLYMALDTCFSIMSDGQDAHVPHFKRIQWMCDCSKIEAPVWATTVIHEEKPMVPVTVLRNKTIHEAIYMGEPLGFSILDASTFSQGSSGNILLEMRALACRLLVYILDGQAGYSSKIDYVGSPINTRCTHGLDFP